MAPAGAQDALSASTGLACAARRASTYAAVHATTNSTTVAPPKVSGSSARTPYSRPPNREVIVTFSYDASGIMAAKFLDVESGRQSDLDIRIEGSDDGSENGSDDSSGAADGPDLQDDDGIDDLLL